MGELKSDEEFELGYHHNHPHNHHNHGDDRTQPIRKHSTFVDSLDELNISSTSEEEEEEEHLSKKEIFSECSEESMQSPTPTINIGDESLFGLAGERLKITLFTIGSRGDVQPMIALGKGLAKHGHICTVATHKEFKEWVEYHGLNFKEVSGNPAEIMQLCVDNGMFTVSFVREAYTKFRTWIDELFDSAYEALKGSDVIIESAVALAGYHIACKLNVPYFGSCTMPWTRTMEFLHPFAASDRYSGWSYNQLSWTIMETVLWRGLRPQINRFRRKVLKIEPVHNGNWYEEERIPFLYSFSRHLVPKPSDWKPWVNVCGFWFLDNSDSNWTPPADLEEFLNDEQSVKPIVYIGFGSMVVPDPDALTRTIIAGVKKAGVRAVISKGWSARGQRQSTNCNSFENDADIYFLQSAPHDWLFPRVAAVMHHGGAGTTAAGLRFGIPTIIKPFFGDQFFWANRIQQMGVGCQIRKLEVECIAATLFKVINDDDMRTRARAIAQKMTAEDGVENAIKVIHGNVAQLRKRIERRKSGELSANRQSWLKRSLLRRSNSSDKFDRATVENNDIELEHLMHLESCSDDAHSPIGPWSLNIPHWNVINKESSGGDSCKVDEDYDILDSYLSPPNSVSSAESLSDDPSASTSPPAPPRPKKRSLLPYQRHRAYKSDSAITVSSTPNEKKKSSLLSRILWTSNNN